VEAAVVGAVPGGAAAAPIGRRVPLAGAEGAGAFLGEAIVAWMGTLGDGEATAAVAVAVARRSICRRCARWRSMRHCRRRR